VIGAVITTYNEAETIGPLVREFTDYGAWAIVVDDHSTDGTPQIAADAGAMVTQTDKRLGIGPCLQAAWRLALEAGWGKVLQIDAGGSHDPNEAGRLLAALDTADMVIGSRFVPGAHYIGGPWHRPHLSRLAAAMCRFALPGTPFRDWTSGYRAFRADALRQLLTHNYQARMHGFQVETLAYAWADGLRIAEVPITYTAGRSSFNRRVAWEAFQVWLDIVDHTPRYRRRAVRA
jgi:glycosyltransferase involved in cell wall biosynthesis